MADAGVTVKYREKYGSCDLACSCKYYVRSFQKKTTTVTLEKIASLLCQRRSAYCSAVMLESLQGIMLKSDSSDDRSKA